MTAQALVARAKEAMERAYAPYSGFTVGAALLGKSGRVYVGCNVENASYPVTCCAERTALFAAVAAGEREFSALAVVGGRGGVVEDFCPPCGICRQALSEFCPAAFPVYLWRPDEIQTLPLGALLPHAFQLEP